MLNLIAELRGFKCHLDSLVDIHNDTEADILAFFVFIITIPVMFIIGDVVNNLAPFFFNSLISWKLYLYSKSIWGEKINLTLKTLGLSILCHKVILQLIVFLTMVSTWPKVVGLQKPKPSGAKQEQVSTFKKYLRLFVGFFPE